MDSLKHLRGMLRLTGKEGSHISAAPPFVHLHVHTYHSHSDALSEPIELAKRTKELGMNAVAVTDHRVGYGLMEVYLACKKQGIKPILGAELNENDRRDVKDSYDRKQMGIRSFHLPVLALNYEGYQNLCRILTDAADAGLYIGPGGHFEETDINWIRQNGYGRGLVALTGCLASRMAYLLLEEQDFEQAKAWLKALQETFDQVYIELQFHSNVQQQRLNLLLLDLHKQTGVPLVATRDAHYILPQDGPIHDIYVACASGWREGYDSHDYYFCAPDEMYEWPFKHPDFLETCQQLGIDPHEPLRNTQRLADQVDIEIPMGNSLMPSFPVPPPHTEATYLRKLTMDSLLRYARRRQEQGSPIYLPEYIDRLEWELRVICDRGNAGYMLILWEIIKWCDENGIITGPGRGSAAGSLVAFLLNITKLDPLEYGLLFQRFLSPDRLDEPDIDVDIADIHRSRVIRHVAEVWGEDHVAQIGTHGTLAVKAATQALAKAMGLPTEKAVALTKPLPPKWPDQTDITFQKLQEIVKDDPDPSIVGDLEPEDIEHMRKLAGDYWEIVNSVEGLSEAIKRVTGAKKSIGIHAGGVAICPRPLDSFIPLTTVPRARVLRVTQYDMDALSQLGVLKMDLLGVRTLSVIAGALDLIERTEGVRIRLSEIPLDIPEVIRLYGTGHLHGIFQGGKAVQKIALEMKPSNFHEIIDLLALA